MLKGKAQEFGVSAKKQLAVILSKFRFSLSGLHSSKLQFHFHSSYRKCGFPSKLVGIAKKESLPYCQPIITHKKKGYTRVGNTHPQKKCTRSHLVVGFESPSSSTKFRTLRVSTNVTYSH